MANTKEVKPQAVASVERPQRASRESRIPVSGPRDILTVTNKDPNFEYRWVKDMPGRVQRFLDAGYEIVVHETEVGQRAVDTGSRLGSAVTRLDGPQTLVLMRISKEWYNEDQDAKQRELNALEASLKPEGLQSLERNDAYQPRDGEMIGRRAK